MTSPKGEAVSRIALRTTIAVAAPGVMVTSAAIGMNAHSMGARL